MYNKSVLNRIHFQRVFMSIIFLLPFSCAKTFALTIHSFIPTACAEFNDSLPFSGVSSIPLCYILFPSTLLHQLIFHPTSLHLVIYFLVYLLVLLTPNSYTILFWEFYFLPFCVHVTLTIRL
jgi:hypothetical protein